MRNTEPKLATRADRTSKIRPEVARLQPMRLVWRMDAGLVFSSAQGLHTGGGYYCVDSPLQISVRQVKRHVSPRDMPVSLLVDG